MRMAQIALVVMVVIVGLPNLATGFSTQPDFPASTVAAPPARRIPQLAASFRQMPLPDSRKPAGESQICPLVCDPTATTFLFL
jgi:hypothetical protein